MKEMKNLPLVFRRAVPGAILQSTAITGLQPSRLHAQCKKYPLFD
jgi:hypothetical protein